MAVLALAAVYVFNGWTPSHYGLTAGILGIADAGPLIGTAHPARSDEWLVATPYFQIAVANRLGGSDALSPYHEPLKAFFALPSRDWSMIFKPDLWGFLVLDPAHAYSLHFASLAVALVVGFTLLLRQLGCSRGFAVGVAILLFLSQMTQVWWTSNAPSLALAPWPAVAFLWRARWWLRLAAVFYATAAWLIGELYPPFILAGGLAIGILILAFRRDTLRACPLLVGGLGVAAAIGVAWLHYADLIAVMQATVFPGHRRANGGGVPVMWLLAQIFPHLTTQRFEPLPLWNTNACEIAVVGSFLPLAVAAFADWRALGTWVREHWIGVAIWLAGMAAMIGWMLLPIPAGEAPILNMIPPGRMLWGLGILFLLGVGIVGGAAPWRISAARGAIFVAAVAGAWWVSKFELTRTPLAYTRFDMVVIPPVVAAMLLSRWRPAAVPPRPAVLLALVMGAALTFGRFNPVQPAQPIFERHASLGLQAIRAYAAANPRGVAVVTGNYGAALNAAGIPAINHVLLRPAPEMFSAAYPTITTETRNRLFNRYEHVIPTVAWEPRSPQADVVEVPPDPFAIPLPVDTSPRRAPTPPGGAILELGVRQLGPGRWGVLASGWAEWEGVTPSQRLRVTLRPGFQGRIVSAVAYRLPLPGLAAAQGNARNFAAGFGARIVMESPVSSPDDLKSALVFGSFDGVRGERTLPPAT